MYSLANTRYKYIPSGNIFNYLDNAYTCILGYLPLLNETKKGGETSKSKILRLQKGNIGLTNSHKSTGDKMGIPGGWVIYWLGDALLPYGRHAITIPILSQSIKLLHLIMYRTEVYVLTKHFTGVRVLLDSSAGSGYCSYAGVPDRQYRACAGMSSA